LYEEEAPNDETMQLLQQLLSLLGGLRQLRHLQACLSQYGAAADPVMQWTALVASTQLTLLWFSCVDVRPGECVTSKRCVTSAVAWSWYYHLIRRQLVLL
jgi:hypothetical protein